jgi:hypothetical protein
VTAADRPFEGSPEVVQLGLQPLQRPPPVLPNVGGLQGLGQLAVRLGVAPPELLRVLLLLQSFERELPDHLQEAKARSAELGELRGQVASLAGRAAKRRKAGGKARHVQLEEPFRPSEVPQLVLAQVPHRQGVGKGSVDQPLGRLAEQHLSAMAGRGDAATRGRSRPT